MSSGERLPADEVTAAAIIALQRVLKEKEHIEITPKEETKEEDKETPPSESSPQTNSEPA